MIPGAKSSLAGLRESGQEAGAGARHGVQVPRGGHQRVRPRRVVRDLGVQDVPARLPRGALGDQDLQVGRRSASLVGAAFHLHGGHYRVLGMHDFIQGDTSRWSKPRVDTKTKVVF